VALRVQGAHEQNGLEDEKRCEEGTK